MRGNGTFQVMDDVMTHGETESCLLQHGFEPSTRLSREMSGIRATVCRAEHSAAAKNSMTGAAFLMRHHADDGRWHDSKQ